MKHLLIIGARGFGREVYDLAMDCIEAGAEFDIKGFLDDKKDALDGLGENIVRAKGIVPTEDGSWLFFDYVPGDTDIRKGAPAYTGLITVIGEKVDIELIKKLFRVM